MFRFLSVFALAVCLWAPYSYAAGNRALKVGIYHMWPDGAVLPRKLDAKFFLALLRVELSVSFGLAGQETKVIFAKPLPGLEFNRLSILGGNISAIVPSDFFKALRGNAEILRELEALDFIFIITPDFILHQPMKIDLVDDKSGEVVSGMMYNALGGVAERSGQIALIRFDDDAKLFRNRIMHETGHLLGLPDSEGEECRKNLNIMCWPVRPEMKMDDGFKKLLQKYPGKMR